MPAIGSLHCGAAIQVPVGTTLVVRPEDGAVLGLWMTATGSVTMWDAATAGQATTPNLLMPITVIPAAGWFAFPAITTRGLVITTTVALVAITV